MNANRIKIFAIVIFALMLLPFAFIRPNQVNAVNSDDEETIASYKKQCAMCHKATAEKFFDLAKTDEEHVEVILKGKKAEKPPHMPGYEEKGMTPDQAKKLAEYMRKLRTEAAP